MSGRARWVAVVVALGIAVAVAWWALHQPTPTKAGDACTHRFACITLEKIPKTPWEPGGSAAACRSSRS